MYDKLEQLRDTIADIEMDENDKDLLLRIVEDLEREIEIQEGAYNYLSEEENYE